MARKVPLKMLGVDPKDVRSRIDARMLSPEEAVRMMQDDLFVDYAALIAEIMDKPSDPRQSMSREDVRTYCAITNKVKESSSRGHVLLEETDYAVLVRKVEAYRGWMRSHDNIVTFIDDMKGAKKVEVDEIVASKRNGAEYSDGAPCQP